MPVDNRRIAKNTLMLYIRMLLLMAVSLYTARVILAVLGVDDYGIYNLIGGFITLFSFVSTALVNAMQRYFNVSLGRNDMVEYQRIYSMGIIIFVIFSVFLLLVGESIGLWFVKTQLNIPQGREVATLWVYQVSLVTLIVTLFRTPDNASIIAHEKMEFYAYVSIFEALLKLAIVFTLSAFNTDKLILYVLLYLGSTLLINVLYSVYCHAKIPQCRFSVMWDKPLFNSLVSFSGWNMLSGGARVFKSQSDAYFINFFYSVAVNAAFGIAAQVYNAVNLFLVNFQTAFRPQLVQSYASGEIDEHYALIFRSSRLSYYLLLIIVIPVVFNLNGLLVLWLKEVPQYTMEFCLFVLFAYLIDALGAPLATSVSASGRIKGMQIASALFLFFGLVTGFICLRAGAQPYIISVIILAIHFCFWLSYIYYARKICGVSLRSYVREVVIPVALVSLVAIILPAGLSFVKLKGWLILMICAVEVVWVSASSFFFGMKPEERVVVLNSVVSISKRLIKK